MLCMSAARLLFLCFAVIRQYAQILSRVFLTKKIYAFRDFFFAGEFISSSSYSSLAVFMTSFLSVSSLPSASYNAHVVLLLVVASAYLNKLRLQTLFAEEIVGELANFGRFLAIVGELLDVGVRREMDDERLERAVFPVEDIDRAIAAKKIARELAFALFVGGGDARRGVHCSNRFSPSIDRAERKLVRAKDCRKCRH